VRYSVEVAADHTGLHPEIIRYYCQSGLLGDEYAEREPDPTFDADALFALRRIEHYRTHHGVNRHALPLLGALEREVDRLEGELRFLRGP
jgi:DNA-binding transcriptional MerR regulator